jgi:peptide/nickel transport system ATP-binding protein
MTAPPPGGTASPDDVVLRARHVSVDYAGQRPTHAVRDVSLELRRGEILGIAGESGCGKSTLAFALAQVLQPPAVRTGGTITFTGTDGSVTDLTALEPAQLRAFKWDRLAIVFQSAMNALNPVVTIGQQINHIFSAHRAAWPAQQRRERAEELLTMVGIDRGRLRSFPHELSGGMRQRVGIAMALALTPDVVIMDEPTTALDVVVQREILDQIDELQAEMGFAVIFITHDIALLQEISDRLAVMYAGRIVEQAPTGELMNGGSHPYTRGLLRSFPDLHAERRRLRGIPGSPPDLRQPLPGCPFRPRCEHDYQPCSSVLPPLRVLSAGPGADHLVACHLHDPDYAAGRPALDEASA